MLLCELNLTVLWRVLEAQFGTTQVLASVLLEIQVSLLNPQIRSGPLGVQSSSRESLATDTVTDFLILFLILTPEV